MSKSPEKKSKLSSISVVAAGSNREYQRYHSPQLQPCEPFYELSKKRRISPNISTFAQIDPSTEINEFEAPKISNNDPESFDKNFRAKIIVPEYPPSVFNNPESMPIYPNRMRMVLSSGENLNQLPYVSNIRKAQSTGFDLSELNKSGEINQIDFSEKPAESIRARYIKKKKSDLP